MTNADGGANLRPKRTDEYPSYGLERLSTLTYHDRLYVYQKKMLKLVSYRIIVEQSLALNLSREGWIFSPKQYK